MNRHRRRRVRYQQVAELSITAFMNLMVVLVPFLLILAVFSRVTIHDLSLPGRAEQQEDAPALQLEVVLRGDRIVLNDRVRGQLGVIENGETGYDLERLREWLHSVKAEAPELDRATILLERQIEYQSLISVMDIVRGDGHVELFPRVSIGDAPPQEEPSA